jgi:hypothetical protein
MNERSFEGLKYEFGRFLGLHWKVAGTLVNLIQNLEQGEGLKCKIEWPWDDLQIEFTNEGLR